MSSSTYVKYAMNNHDSQTLEDKQTVVSQYGDVSFSEI